MHNKKNSFKNKKFFKGEKWLELRREVLNLYGAVCMKCGEEGNHVDHIKPKSIHYDLIYEVNNLQVLCAKCNIEKSYLYEEDYRTDDDINSLVDALGDNEILNKYFNYRITLKKNKLQKLKKKSLWLKSQRNRKIKESKEAAIEEARLERIRNKPKTILRKRASTK